MSYILTTAISHSFSITYRINHLILQYEFFFLYDEKGFLNRGMSNLIFFRVHKIPERRFTENSLLKNARALVMVSFIALILGFSNL
jgi:hypothetical protein